MKSMHRESPLLPASSREASLSPLLAKQDRTIPGLLRLMLVWPIPKEGLNPSQFLRCDSQVSNTTPKWQRHGLSPTQLELLCMCHCVPAQQFQLCENTGRGVKPWTPSGYNHPSEAAETPLRAAILPRKEPLRINVLWMIHTGTQETTGQRGWTADWLAHKHERRFLSQHECIIYQIIHFPGAYTFKKPEGKQSWDVSLWQTVFHILGNNLGPSLILSAKMFSPTCQKSHLKFKQLSLCLAFLNFYTKS